MGDALSSLIERTLGERAASNVAARVGQLGAQALRASEPETDDRFSLVHLNPKDESRALQEWVYAHKPLAEAPELFYGPFMQLGTKLQLGPKWVQFVVDTVTDPMTYALAGTGGLVAKATKGAVGMTLGGRVARLSSVLAKGATEVGGGAVLDEMERALSAAGKILGSGEREGLIQAARTGSKDLGPLIDKALSLGETKMEPGIAQALGAIRKDRKGIAWIMDHTDEILGYEKLPAHMVPQKGIAAQIATGQANPFLKFSIPSVNPVNLTRQLVGIGYQGEHFYTPFSKSILSRGARTLTGSAEGVLTGRASAQLSARRFEARPYTPGDVTVKDFGYTLDHMEAALASPLDRPNVQAAEEIAFNKAAVDKIWNALPKESRKSLSKDEFATKVYNQQRRSLMDVDRNRLASRQDTINRLAGQAEQAAQPFGPPAPGGVGAELAQAGELASAQVRRYGDMFSVENLMREGTPRDFHLQLSGNLRQITQWSSFVDGQWRDILVRNFGGLEQADEIDSILRYVRESPTSWTSKTVNGEERLFLKADGVKPDTLFSDRLSLSRGDSLRTYLTQTGLPSEVVQMVERSGQSLDAIGANLKSEKALLGYLDAYWPRILSRNSAFTKRFGEGAEGWSTLSNKVLYDPESLSDIAPDLVADLRRLTGKAKAQKISVQETRKLTDELGFALEKAGYGTYESSSGKTLAHALDSYGKAHYERRLFDEFGALGGKGAYEDLRPDIKKLVTADAWNAVDKNGVSHVRDVYGDGEAPPENVRAAFMSIKLRSGAPKLLSDAEAARRASEVLVGEVRATALEDLAQGKALDVGALELAEAQIERRMKGIPIAAREQVAKDLAGVKQLKVGDKVVRVRTARVREAIPGSIEGTFDPEWVRMQDYPEHLRYGKEIAAEVERRVAKEEAKLKGFFEAHRASLYEGLSDKREAAVRAAYKEISAARGLTSRETQRIVEAEANQVPARATVWVRKDLANHFIEPLALWEQQGLNKASMQAWGKLNSTLKGMTLLGDVFHLHSITMNQLAGGGPAQFFKFLLDPQGRLLPGVEAGAFGTTERFSRLRQQAVVGAGLGAAAGAGAGAAFGGEPSDIATLSLTGALYGAALGAARINEAWGKRLSLSPDGFEFLYWMGKGGWTGRPDDRSIGMASRWLKSFRDDLIRKHPNSFLISPIDGVRHINDVWEKELWGTAHNGGKHWLFATLWNDELPKLERKAGFSALKPAAQEAAKEGLARQVMQFTNNAMGGQNVAALLAHPSWQHYARWGLLAPDWTESRIQMASGFFHGLDPVLQGLVGAALGTTIEAAEAGFDPEQMSGMGLVGGAGLGILAGKWSQRVASRLMTKGDVTAKLARKASSTALLSLFITGNLLNRALSGHWLWENEEGKKTSIQLPGRSESGRQRYLSFGKQWLEAFEFAGISEKDGFAIPVAGRLASKLSVPVSWGMHVLMNDNRYGMLATADDNAVERLGNIVRFTGQAVTPIIAQGPIRLGLAAAQGQADLGGVAEAATRFAGFPLSRSPYPMSTPVPAAGFFNAIKPLSPPTLESKFK